MKNTIINNQFKQTKRMFEGAIGASGAISYEEWSKQPEDMRAAILFVNFYDQITLAWYKEQGEHTYEEDAVDEAMHICSKLCGLSTKQPTQEKANCGCVITNKTYTPAYIFNAMRNAFNSLNYERRCTRSDYRHQDAIEGKVDEIQVQAQYFTDANGDMQDLFQTIDGGNQPDIEMERTEFWSIIEGNGEDVEKVILKLLDLDEKVTEARRAAAKEKDAEKRKVKLNTVARVEATREKYRKANEKVIGVLQGSMAQFVHA